MISHKDVQIKTMIRYHYTSVRAAKIKKVVTVRSAGEVVEKLDLSDIIDKECKTIPPLWKILWKFLKK